MLVASLAFAQFAAAAATKVSDADVEKLRQNIFRETAHGQPGISEADINVDFLKRLYASNNAAPALQRILTSSRYSAINEKIGRLRHEANLQIWAQVVAETGARIELNNAGKTNGALSDLDNTLYTDVQVMPLKPDVPADGIHDALLERHEALWRQRFGVGTEAFDMGTFRGDGLLQDWRMSTQHWSDFVLQVDATIAQLGSQPGTYVIPGAYKPQVYGRYLSDEGKTIVIEPVLDPEANAGQQLDDLPPGVRVSPVMSTREASRLYGNVPFDIDRTGALEAVLGNFHRASAETATMKNAKYSNRWIDTGLVSLTNLEVDFRQLMLRGHDGARRRMVEKLFGEFAQKGLLPGDFADLDDVQRTLETLTRIELDKVVSGYEGKARPKHWSGEWRSHKARDINQAETKKRYFKAEYDAIRNASPAALDLAEADLIQMAESAFRDKARGLARLSAVVAARRVFNDVFARDGFTRQRHLHGDDAARRLLAERVRGLHAALAFQSDPKVTEMVLETAPAETHDIIKNIADIARAQREAVIQRKGAFDGPTAEQLGESDAALRRLMVRLGIGTDDVPNVKGQTRVRSFALSDAEARTGIGHIMKDTLIKGGRGAANVTAEQTRAFFAAHIGPNSPGLLKGTLNGLYDVGTVDSAGKIIAAYATGDLEGAKSEVTNTVIGAIPGMGTFYNAASALKAGERGDWSPTLQFIGKIAAEEVGYGGAASYAMALYGLEKSLFKLGWHFYGVPTQSEGISLVLMGDASMARGAERSRFPILKLEGELVRKNAILPNKFSLPQLPADFRKQLIRAHFLVAANQKATAGGRSAPGQFSDWEVDRNRALRSFERDSHYWLRRVFFYQQTHIGFFRWVQSRTSDQNWQRIDKVPPTRLLEMSESDLLAEYPKARTVNGLWDHETIWMTDYFRSWVQEWEKSMPEHGEMLYNLDTVAPWWRQAAVDELVAMFREGELLDLEAPMVEKDAERAANTADYKQSVRNGLDQIAEEGLDARRLELHKQLEGLLWNEKTVGGMKGSVVGAAAGEPEYKPEPPRLVVNIPRPVCARGRNLPVDILVVADAQAAPAPVDFELGEVIWKKTGEYKGQRPEEVLRDDVRTLLGREVEDEELMVAKFDAVFTMTSKSDPSVSATETKTVYWLGPLPKDLPSPSPGGTLTIDPNDLLERMRAVATRAGATAKDAGELCALGREKAEEASARVRAAEATLAESERALAAAAALLDKLIAQKQESATLRQTIEDLAAQLSRLRHACEEATLKTCQETARLQNATTEEERAAAGKAARAAGLEFVARKREAETLREKLLGAEAQLIELCRAMAAALPDLAAIRARIGEAGKGLQQAGAGFVASQESLKTSKGKAAGLAKDEKEGKAIDDEAARILGPDKEQPAIAEALREIEALQEQVVALHASAGNCPAAALAAMKEPTEKRATLEEQKAKQDTRGKELAAKLAASKIAGACDAHLEKAQLAILLAEAYWEAIVDLTSSAGNCLRVATNIIKTPFFTSVPPVVGLGLKEAETAVGSAGLKANRAGGDPAPSEKKRFTVQRQIPAPFARVKPGSEVQMVVYSDFNPMLAVPAVIGMAIQQAEKVIAGAGFKVARAGGDPAPAKEKSFTVASQTPAAGNEAKPGAPVTLVIYGEHQPLVQVPSVVGLTIDAAEGMITGAGFTATRAGGDPAPSRDLSFTIQSQQPAAGAAAKPGETVALIIHGKYEPPVAQASPTPGAAAAPPPPPVASGSGEPFYVKFNVFMPEPKRPKPKKVKYKDYFARLSVRDVRWVLGKQKEGKSKPIILAVDGAGLEAYAVDAFAPGKQYSAPIQVRVRAQGKSANVSGALLLKSMGSTPGVPPVAGDTFAMLADGADGKYSLHKSDAQMQIDLTGGPLVEGWPLNMQRACLQMVKQLVVDFDCFVATAVYAGNRDAWQVQEFRRFRDEVLQESEPGRKFIDWYYEHGPALAAAVRAHPEGMAVLRVGFDALALWLKETDWQDEDERARLAGLAALLGDIPPAETPVSTP